MSETRIKDLKLDEIYELRKQKKVIEDKIKELEKPYKTSLFRDGLCWETDKILMDMEQTKRFIITPDLFQKNYPEFFMDCITVSVEKAKAAIKMKLNLIKDEEVVDKIRVISTETDYQKLLNFKEKK